MKTEIQMATDDEFDIVPFSFFLMTALFKPPVVNSGKKEKEKNFENVTS